MGKGSLWNRAKGHGMERGKTTSLFINAAMSPISEDLGYQRPCSHSLWPVLDELHCVKQASDLCGSLVEIVLIPATTKPPKFNSITKFMFKK